MKDVSLKNIITSALVIALMGVYILPDFSFCPNDMGEHHHGNCKDGMMKHDGLSKEKASITVAENTVKFKSQKNCIETKSDADYVVPNQYIIKLSVKQVAILASFISINYDVPEREFFITPDPQCNSDPPLPPNSLRGPPLV